ncbi:NAD(P)-binding domain-containing protein [Hyunsoonleella sp. SJ7]|uniref:NAD(P)-binding domain-containing protein n=1 Tax=Hyunsoonleella aquatilis TaxID=2762758 RepID=A0A923H7U0_9FLAO|nr:NAD(P)-binding domain-containing protein [Hyunsoonleella aquatilis]MBC3757428.1 NAD(P)-binding domain-containing protein [Hyunsoonleella aquatilis]
MKANRILDVVVIGAGHAGISVSYYLKKENIPHMVFEKGRIGESWRSLRWDSFALNTPNWMNCLPEDTPPAKQKNNFYTKKEYIDYLQDFVNRNGLPILENSKVIRLTKNDRFKLFEIAFDLGRSTRYIFAKSIIVASGILNVPKIPELSKRIGKQINQIHVSKYRNASQLPKGTVLVIGGGQSGCQVTEDLLNAERKVYLSSSKVGRVPRRYRGRDFTEWFDLIKHWDEPIDKLADRSIITATNPLMSGVGTLGHSISLQGLNKKGATIVGRLNNATLDVLHFEDNVKEHIQYADEYCKDIKKRIDAIIQEKNISAACPKEDMDVSGDISDVDITKLELKVHNITTIIWATGFTGNFKWIQLPVLDQNYLPIHHKGESAVPGLVFFGFPWLASRKSGIVYGLNDEAQTAVKKIKDFLAESIKTGTTPESQVP